MYFCFNFIYEVYNYIKGRDSLGGEEEGPWGWGWAGLGGGDRPSTKRLTYRCNTNAEEENDVTLWSDKIICDGYTHPV